MQPRTIAFIIIGSVVLIAAGMLFYISSFVAEIEETTQEQMEELEQSLAESDSFRRAMRKRMDSLQAQMMADSPGFKYDTTPIDTVHSFILEGSKENPNIFLGSEK